jgi:hypothetical protein
VESVPETAAGVQRIPGQVGEREEEAEGIGDPDGIPAGEHAANHTLTIITPAK